MSSILSVVVVNVVAQSRHTTTKRYFIFRFFPQERGKTDFVVFWTASSSKIDPPR